MTHDLTHATQREALTRYLRQAPGWEGATIARLEKLSGGAIQQNWLLDLSLPEHHADDAHTLVLRTDAPSGVAASHGRAQEYALLQAAYAAGVTVPEPLRLCEDVAVIGRPFFLMRRVGGTAAGHRLVKDMRLGGDRQALAVRLGQELARIHTIRPGMHPSLAFLPDDATLPPARAAIQRAYRFLDALGTPYPALEWGLRWLDRHAPTTEARVLCHRDFRTGNYMVDEHGLTGILDWEFAGWGDPLEDIGWFCAKCWRFGAHALEAGGIGTREDFYRGYESTAGRTIDRDAVAYWEVMAHMNWAVIALQQAARHASGEEVSLNLALIAHIVPELEWEILNMTGAD